MAELPTVSALWIGGTLTWLERVCLKSFVDRGHHTILYTYEDVKGVPEGVDVQNGEDIISVAKMPKHGRTGSPALFSDLFRYHMMVKRPGEIWIDTDMYCWRPVNVKEDHVFGYESGMQLNGAILRLPPDSEALGLMLEFTKDEYSIPDFISKDQQREYAENHEAGRPTHVSEMPWGIWGPLCVTHFLKRTGEDRFAKSQDVFYPVHFRDRQDFFKRPMVTFRQCTDDTMTIHLWARRVKRFASKRSAGAADPSSFFGWALNEHDIDFDEGLIARTYREPLGHVVEPGGGGARMSLDELGQHYEADKAAKKHKYTRLYELFLRPLRDRKINLLELGLQWGGPEHGNKPDRETTNAPSVRMWWDYFPKAHVYGIDISDFSWLDDERFSFIQCDLDDRTQVKRTAAALPTLDVVVDDASGASKHQQDAFLELFPKLRSGGYYIIEDLHAQLALYEDETPEITKTRDLFRSLLETKRFVHSDPKTEHAFNVLRPTINQVFIFQNKFLSEEPDKVLVVQKA